MLIRRMTLLALLVVGTVSTAKADFLIDDFSLPNPRNQYAIGPDANPLVINTDLGGGLTRVVTLTVNGTPGINSLTGQVGGGPATGFFTASFDVASSGTANIAYTYASAQNFNPNNNLGSLQFLGAGDSGFAADIPLAITITTATGSLTFNGNLPLTNVLSPVDIPLALFVGTGDFTQVTGVTINMTGGQAADFVFDSLGVTTPQAPLPSVPAPPAAFLALAAIPALGIWRARRKAAAQA